MLTQFRFCATDAGVGVPFAVFRVQYTDAGVVDMEAILGVFTVVFDTDTRVLRLGSALTGFGLAHTLMVA